LGKKNNPRKKLVPNLAGNKRTGVLKAAAHRTAIVEGGIRAVKAGLIKTMIVRHGIIVPETTRHQATGTRTTAVVVEGNQANDRTKTSPLQRAMNLAHRIPALKEKAPINAPGATVGDGVPVIMAAAIRHRPTRMNQTETSHFRPPNEAIYRQKIRTPASNPAQPPPPLRRMNPLGRKMAAPESR
jgi:hypothetical protein